MTAPPGDHPGPGPAPDTGNREPATPPARLGLLELRPALEHLHLVAAPVAAALSSLPAADCATVLVTSIDPAAADTAEFCARYRVDPAVSANCVVVAGRRDGAERMAACVVLATTRVDVNGLVRRQLDVRKLSFASRDVVVARTGMEYGGITPLGLPTGWPILVDHRVPARTQVLVGSGVRGSKLVLPGQLLARLPGAVVLADVGRT